MNTVRLNLDFRAFEEDDAPYEYKPEGWAWLDERIAWAKAQGVHVILDMHAPQGAIRASASAAPSGAVAPSTSPTVSA